MLRDRRTDAERDDDDVPHFDAPNGRVGRGSFNPVPASLMYYRARVRLCI